MKKTLILLFITIAVMLNVGQVFAREVIPYQSVSPEEAWEMMQTESETEDQTEETTAKNLPLIVLDVRTAEEYENVHIPGAVLLPVDDIETLYEEVLPEKEQTILIYCRSGRRSKLAAEFLAQAGYTSIFEFGGIIDWPYDTEEGPYVAPDTCQHNWAEDCTGKTCLICEAHIYVPVS